MRLTKIDVAEAHLITAVRATFEQKHPASIYLLASSAREILTTLGSKLKIRTVLHGVALETGRKLGRLIEATHQYANFFKHADKDPAAILEFDPAAADQVLFIAVDDFGRVAGGMPIELQVYQAWYMTTAYGKVSKAPLRQQPLIRAAIPMFPGIRAANRSDRCALGLAALAKAEGDSRFAMQINREVILPVEDADGTDQQSCPR